MNKFIKKAIFIMSGILILTSCDSLRDILNSASNSNEASNIPSFNTSTDTPTSTVSKEVPPISNDPDAFNNFYKPTSFVYDNDALGKSIDVATWRSVGNQKIMVVPVKFSNSPAYGGDAAVKTTLEKTFFGATEDTGWESLASYYRKSSYGKLNISGEVLAPHVMPYSTSTLEGKAKNDTYWDQTHYVLESIYNTLPASKLKEYDLNNDGYVDAIFMVYLAPTSGDVFWAYQYYWNRYPNSAKPTFNTYAWASYTFTDEHSGYTTSAPDAHTFIHETGHLLGLEDYYDYDNKTMTSGGIDMMDFNIIDHNMYSKFVSNWSQPYVPIGNSDITLRPAESSGDFILLNKNWNGHGYDEYIMIEYYTPTGLNQKDTASAYGGVKSFNIPGVRIYHVDSRLLTVHSDSDKRWSDTINTVPGLYSEIGPSNTGSQSADKTFKLIHLLDAAGRSPKWYGSTTSLADNLSLFKTGNKIEINNWQRYLFERGTFNDGSEIGFSVEIGAMTAEGVDIKIRTA